MQNFDSGSKINSLLTNHCKTVDVFFPPQKKDFSYWLQKNTFKVYNYELCKTSQSLVESSESVTIILLTISFCSYSSSRIVPL